MKSVFFTTFLEMVSDRYSDDVVDKIIEASELSTDGAYTSIGNYDYKELVKLVINLSRVTKIEIPALLESYGHYLLQSSSNFYLDYFSHHDKRFDFHKAVQDTSRRFLENNHHDVEQVNFNRINLKEKAHDSRCISERPFTNLIEGIVKECKIDTRENRQQNIEDNIKMKV